MWTRRALLVTPALAFAQSSLAFGQDDLFLCPMDPDVRQKQPGRCPRCGMKLVAGIPHYEEFPVAITSTPRRVEAGRPVRLRFQVLDPKTRQPSTTPLEEIHEKLLHLFVLDASLGFFAHEHPELQPDGSFLYEMTFPHAGHYRLACDFYPRGATPQMVSRSLIVGGGATPAGRAPLSPAELIRLETDPAEPLPGSKTLLHFHLAPSIQLEPYLGALGHLLVASPDLIDLVHTHPFLRWPDGRLQFNVIFARPGLHRVWVQVQDAAVVRTVAFDVLVKTLT
jgi:hypothetical protein